MRGFGILAIIVGVIVVFGAMAMDVSVSTGMGGRVNNIGLMAQQQNFIIVGGLITLGGILLMLFGSKKQVSAQQMVSTWEAKDSRPCPFCAEPIKHAAIKCKHCGSDVEKASAPQPVLNMPEVCDGDHGWVAIIPADNAAEFERRSRVARELNLDVVSGDGMPILCGYYESRGGADQVCQRLIAECGIDAKTKYVPPQSN